MYTRDEGYREPLGRFKADNACRFEKWVERVCKHIVKAFPKGLNGRKTAEKQCIWPLRLLDICNKLLQMKWVCVPS